MRTLLGTDFGNLSPKTLAKNQICIFLQIK